MVSRCVAVLQVASWNLHVFRYVRLRIGACVHINAAGYVMVSWNVSVRHVASWRIGASLCVSLRIGIRMPRYVRFRIEVYMRLGASGAKITLNASGYVAVS